MTARGRWRVHVVEGLRWWLLMIDLDDRYRISRAIDRLAIQPAPPERKPLRGTRRLYREQCGDYRILYVIEGGDVVVVSLGVGPRGLPAKYLRAPPG